MTGYQELASACLTMGAMQFLTTGLFRRKLRAEFSGARSEHHPPVSVIVPCKGTGRYIRRNVESMLAQDYPGRIEWIFVAPSASDPAHAALREILSAAIGRPRLLVSDAHPTRCSEKIQNVLCGIDHADAASHVLLLAEVDLHVGGDWARRLVAPLADPRVGVATTQMLYAPEDPGLAGFLRKVWMGFALSYEALFPFVMGQSYAIRRDDFVKLGVREAWAGSLSEDGTLDRLIRRAGLTVRFVGRSVPVSSESCSWPQLFAQLNRWVFIGKVYVRGTWLLCLALAAAKVWLLSRLLWTGNWGLLLWFWGLDMANLWAVFRTIDSFFADRLEDEHPAYHRRPILAALCAPLLLGLVAANFAASIFMRRTSWGGYIYRVRGPDAVEIENAATRA